MNLAGVMDELGTALEAIAGLRVFPYSAERITPPAAMVGWPDPIMFDQTMARGMDRVSMPVWVMVGRSDARNSRDALAPYLSGSGAGSVKAALDDAEYTACDTVRVVSATVQTFTIASVDYLGAEFLVDITGQGAS